jgi:hypothetical protein
MVYFLSHSTCILAALKANNPYIRIYNWYIPGGLTYNVDCMLIKRRCIFIAVLINLTAISY